MSSEDGGHWWMVRKGKSGQVSSVLWKSRVVRELGRPKNKIVRYCLAADADAEKDPRFSVEISFPF